MRQLFVMDGSLVQLFTAETKAAVAAEGESSGPGITPKKQVNWFLNSTLLNYLQPIFTLDPT